MKNFLKKQEGKLSTYVLFWLFGVPVPVLLLIFFARGCH